MLFKDKLTVKIPIKIDDPEDIDWAHFWEKKVEAKSNIKKDWDEAAKKFGKYVVCGGYTEKLISKLKLDKDDTVLDLGCGDGTITIPIAKKVKSVTGLDLSEKMLEILNKTAKEENINNITTIKKDLSNIKLSDVNHHDIVLLSRSIMRIKNIQELILNINEIANKYVFITIYGDKNWKIEKEFYESIDKEYPQLPTHRYLFNLLLDMGISPNVENLNLNHHREYENLDDFFKRRNWNLTDLTNNEIEKLKDYLNDILKVNPENGNLYNETDIVDWVLIWWKVEN